MNHLIRHVTIPVTILVLSLHNRLHYKQQIIPPLQTPQQIFYSHISTPSVSHYMHIYIPLSVDLYIRYKYITDNKNINRAFQFNYVLYFLYHPSTLHSSSLPPPLSQTYLTRVRRALLFSQKNKKS